MPTGEKTAHYIVTLDDPTRPHIGDTGIEHLHEFGTLLGRQVVQGVFLHEQHLDLGAFWKVCGLVKDDVAVSDVGFEENHLST